MNDRKDFNSTIRMPFSSNDFKGDALPVVDNRDARKNLLKNSMYVRVFPDSCDQIFNKNR